MSIRIEVAPGEVIDKLTILEIKRERIEDEAKRRNVAHEYEVLTRDLDAAVAETAELSDLRAQLKAINETLWQIEDDIRECERRKDFGNAFIELARAVYHTNDKRAAVKRRINEVLKSDILEEKSYAAY
jgi:3-methyladenine DNA glycosylase/8-oxoguanine DNA glycosylase